MEKREWHIIKLDEVASTNTYLDVSDNNKELPEGSVVVAHTQTAGRGQRGNSWEASPGKNLTFSYLLRPRHIAPNEQFILSQAVVLAIADVLSHYTDHISVKWPNDVYYKDSKIGGILIEHQLSGMSITRTIVGIGLNINQEKFESNAPNPISLTQITGVQYNTETILLQILDATSHRYAMSRNDRAKLQADYASLLYRKDGLHLYKDNLGEFYATIKEVQPDGHLILTDSDKRNRCYAFKEVAFVME